MSLLTQCPACSTLYRVVPDQLRISEGWVKCGQCSEIFDASKHLMEPAGLAIEQGLLDAALTTDSETSQDKPEHPQVDDGVTSNAPVDPDAADTRSGTSTAYEAAEISAPHDHLTPNPFPQDAVAGGRDVDSYPTDQQTPQEPPSDDLTTQPQLRWDDYPEGQEDHLAHQEASGDAGSMPSFLAQNASTHPWKKPWVRGALMASMVILFLTLAGQWLHLEKDQLAAQHPEMKVALTGFCTLFNCTVDPLQRIENLSVDSVGFSQLGKDSYRLNFVLKNSSPLALAMPSVELSLTDAQDQTTYRRVFSGGELGRGYSKEIAGGSERPFSLAFRVNIDTSENTVRGYRVLIFYP
jgi:predicted Zn finger-like uncharacterized protein